MAYYQVGTDGKAPAGLKAGDLVVTGGGTYKITGGSYGNYTKEMYNPSLNTSNFTGSYASSSVTPAQTLAQATSPVTQQPKVVASGQGASVSNPNQGTLYYDPATGRITRTLNGVNYYVDKGDEKYNSIYAEGVSRGVITPSSQVKTESTVEIPQYQAPDTSAQMAQLQGIIDQLTKTQYQPTDVKQEMANTMTYEQAYELAKRIVEPQYADTYQQTANAAAQNLNRAGLVDSLYGQALASEAQDRVTKDMNAQMGELALNIQNNDWQKAAQTLSMIMDEKQFGANYNQNALTTAAQLSMNFIDSIVQQASAANNYALQVAGIQLQQEAYNLEALYTQGKMTQMELENKMAELEMKAAQMAQSTSGSGSGGGGGGGGGEAERYANLLQSGNYTAADVDAAAIVLGLTPLEVQQYKQKIGNNNSPYNSSLQLLNGIVRGWAQSGLSKEEAFKRLMAMTGKYDEQDLKAVYDGAYGG